MPDIFFVGRILPLLKVFRAGDGFPAARAGVEKQHAEKLPPAPWMKQLPPTPRPAGQLLCFIADDTGHIYRRVYSANRDEMHHFKEQTSFRSPSQTERHSAVRPCNQR